MVLKEKLLRITGNNPQRKSTDSKIEQTELGSALTCRTSQLFLRSEVHCNIKVWGGFIISRSKKGSQIIILVNTMKRFQIKFIMEICSFQ